MRKFIRTNLIRIGKLLGLQKFKKQYGVRVGDAQKIFDKLDSEGICYVVLRWFDELPKLNPDEDMDILVADEDFAKIKKILQRGRSEEKDFVRFDVYPAHNLTGNIASYYVPSVAEKILANRIKMDCNVWTPNKNAYFYSLCYHALFHKGFNAGIPSKFIPNPTLNAKHNFVEILGGLAAENGVQLPEMTMEAIEEHLKETGWLPPLDVYFRRSKLNEWAKLRSQELIEDTWSKNRGSVVFILRSSKVGTPIEAKLKDMIKEAGAEIVTPYTFNEEQAKIFAARTRGGDWGVKLPGSEWGGLPTYAIFARKSELHNDITDENIPKGIVEYEWVKQIKKDIRKIANKGVAYRKQYHILHTSDNGIEAMYYKSVIEDVLKINDGVESLER